MNNGRTLIKLRDLFLIGFLFLYLLYKALSDAKFETKFNIIILLVSALVGLISMGYNRKVKLNMLVLYLLAGIFVSFVFQQFHFSDTRLFMLYLAGLVLANECETHITKIMLVSRIVLIMLILALGGFARKNGIGSNVGNVVLLYMCLMEDSFTKKQWWVIFAILAALTIFNPGNAGVIVVLSVVLTLQIFRKIKVGRAFLCSKFTMYIYPICLAITYFLSESIRVDRIPLIGRVLPVSVNNIYLSFIQKFNLVLGTRLSLSKTALDRIGIHLLGEDYFSSGYSELILDAANRNGYFLVDSGYILLLLRWGILVAILICVISIITMKFFIKKRAYNFIIAGFALALWAILEDSLFYTFILMFWGKAYKELRYKKRMGINTYE